MYQEPRQQLPAYDASILPDATVNSNPEEDHLLTSLEVEDVLRQADPIDALNLGAHYLMGLTPTELAKFWGISPQKMNKELAEAIAETRRRILDPDAPCERTNYLK